MGTFLVKRLLAALPVIVGVVTLVFLLVHFIPGDPVSLMLGEFAPESDRVRLRSALGLDLPLWRQYIDFWRHFLDGSWGHSLLRNATVSSLVWQRMPATLLLALASLGVALVISFPLGLIAARYAGTWRDGLATIFALMGMSLPIFVVAPLAVLLFAIKLRWLPVAGADSWRHLVLPSLCLGAGMAGVLTRVIRAAVLECLHEDFVRTAHAKGVREQTVLWVHVLRNAMIPVVTVLGNMLGGLLAGAVMTETLFDWPGLGKLFYSAFQSRDYTLIQGIVLWIAMIYVVIGIVVDLLYSYLDPRIRLEA
ncbi:MAG: ABC transporter permease [Bdellovibrionales bacterium]|nr:ABC transporter permease [Bdellovibrionales bacterium]